MNVIFLRQSRMPISTRTSIFNGYATVFPPSMRIYFHSQCLMSIFWYLLWSSCSVQPLVPTGIFGYKICGSWISSQPLKEFTQQQVESSACWFCLFWRLTTTFSFWGPSLLWRLLDHVRHSFQGRYLANWRLFRTTVSCTSPEAAASIGYQMRVFNKASRDATAWGGWGF